MKILLLHNKYQYRGGEDSVLENEYDLLVEHGHTVELLLFDNKSIKSYFDKLTVGLKAIFNTESARALEKKIHSFQPDIIHVHNFFPLASPSIFYTANMLNIPVVMTLHNYRLICPNALLYRDNRVCEVCVKQSFPLKSVLMGCYRGSRIQTFSIALMSYFHKKMKTWQVKVNRYIVLTHFARHKILNSSLEIEANKVTVKPNFVQDHGFNFDKEDYCLFVGRLSEEKGINTLLNAFENSKRRLVLIGTGPLEDKVKASSEKFDHIEYLGFQKIDFVIEKLMKAKALIFTSLWYEGMPMTILESLSTGTPVVCSNLGAQAEIIQNKINGVHYQAGDHFDLIEKVNWLFNSKDYNHLCKNARQEYENKYTAEKNYYQLLQIYQDVINEKN